jgi:hypothetical protein
VQINIYASSTIQSTGYASLLGFVNRTTLVCRVKGEPEEEVMVREVEALVALREVRGSAHSSPVREELTPAQSIRRPSA